MSLNQFLTSAADRVRADGTEGLKDTAYITYRVMWDRVNRLYKGGENVFENDWDILILLDGCRPDYLEKSLEGRFDIKDYKVVKSVGSNSEEWLKKTFSQKYSSEISNTIYVTGNPFSNQCINNTDFGVVDEVWKHYWDSEVGTVRAEAVTDRAIYNWKESNADRMIVHYMQPHFPCVPNPQFSSQIDINRIGEKWESVWDKLRKGKVAESDVRTGYQKNLEYVLDEVNILIDTISFEKAVISADHGNSFGKFGLYGHPRAPIGAIRNVPWCEVKGSEEEKDHNMRVNMEDVDSDIQSKLMDLGYI